MLFKIVAFEPFLRLLLYMLGYVFIAQEQSVIFPMFYAQN